MNKGDAPSPRVSVIVPVYKVEPYIRRCIDSILSQELSDFELILVNDGSPDNCGKICDEYAEKDTRITVIHQNNGGLSAARNKGLDYVLGKKSTKWLTFIDSDDWVHPQYLSALYNAVLQTGLNISSCGYVQTDIMVPYSDEIITVTQEDTELFYTGEQSVQAIVAWNKLYRREDFENIRFPEGKIHEDEYTTYKLLFKNDKTAVVNNALYYYFINYCINLFFNFRIWEIYGWI